VSFAFLVRFWSSSYLDDDRRRDQIQADMRKMMDLASLRIAVATSEPGFEAEYMAPAEQLNTSLRKRIGDGVKGRDAADLLAAYLDAVEAEMAEIAARVHHRDAGVLPRWERRATGVDRRRLPCCRGRGRT
jgi:hypothetical protein